MKNIKAKHADWTGREPFLVHWALLSQTYCVPADMTKRERSAFVKLARADLGDDFKKCPLGLIRDRLFGGVQCPYHSDRRHVLHANEYGFMAAERGQYWPLDDGKREKIAEEYKAKAGELWVGDGPFADGEIK